MRIATKHTLLHVLRLAALTALLLPLGCGDDVRVPLDVPRVDANNSDASTADGTAPDGMEMCEPGLVDCGDGCTRLAGDSAHCGACGNACPSGFSCAIGRCDCEEPLKSCDGTCTDPATDVDNCGTCGNVCGEGDICLEGACVVNCEAPSQRCAGTETEYICSDPQSDSLNCGVCGAACSSGAECDGGSCSCGEGQISCSGACVDPMNDATYCGNCLTSCGVDGVCTDGACSTCGPGLTACGEVARCTDTDTSRLHCGECDNTCGPGATCTAGACACLPGFTDCDGVCAALPSNRDNCGACGVDCGLGTCAAGSCVCAADATMCGAECAVLDSDRNNCGACGDLCESGELCRDSGCLFLNAICETATPITADTTILGEDIAAGDEPPGGTGCGFGSGSKALFYAVTVPAGQRVTATTTSTTSLTLFVQDACTDSGCTNSVSFSDEITVDNATGMSDRTFYIGVRGYSSATGTFDIEFTYVTPVIAPNAACATATVVTTDATFSAQATENGGSRPSATDCGGGSGSLTLYYAATVAAGDRVVVTTAPSADIVLFELPMCGAAACVADTDRSPETLTYTNVTAAPVTHIFGVRPYGSTATPTFDITFTYSTPVIATNDNATCATATAITENTTIAGGDLVLGGARPTGADCGGGSGDTALYYEVTVPVGQRARLVADSSTDLVVFSQDACSDTACSDSSDTPEELTVDNLMGAAVRTEYIGVRGYSSTTGTFDVTVTYTTPVIPTNISCATATVVTADTAFMDQATEFGGPRPSATDCGGGSGLPSLYYAVTVPAGDRVVVTTAPAGDIILFELPMCGAAACVANTDSSPETLTYTNSTAASVTHIFGVRPWSSFSTPPAFGITFTYSTP